MSSPLSHHHPTPTGAEAHLTLRVAGKAAVADGVVEVILEAPDQAPLPAWTPGAHVDVVLAENLVRQYSLCGDPADCASYRIAVLREPESRGGSTYVHDTLAVGDEVGVQGPRNHFELTDVQEYVFIAGGIGITPLIPMMAGVARSGARYRLVYGGRSNASMAFVTELCAAHPDLVDVWPQDERGLLDLAAIIGEPRPDTAVYTCGPAPLLDAVESTCAHWPSESIHMERFRPKEIPDGPANTEFEIELAQSAMTLTVPAGRSILDVIEDAGVTVLSSCREGTCGTCEIPILDGRADHRDSLLTPDEQEADDTMFICVSRARSERLILDL